MTKSDMRCPVVSFDHRSPELAQNRDEISREISKDPIFYTEAWGGFYVVTSHKLEQQVLRDNKTFSSAKAADGSRGVAIPPVPVRFIPAEVDVPEHTKIRRLLNPLFTHDAIEKFRPRVEQIIDHTLNDVAAKGEFDIVRDVAEVIPGRIVLAYMGFDIDAADVMVKAGQSAMGTAENPEAAQAGFEKMRAMIENLIEERRATPNEDLTSYLVNQEEYAFEGDDLFWLLFTLVVGGIENVTALVSNVLYELAMNTSLRESLIADPSRLDSAVEEFLRYFTPGGGLARTVIKDVELGGVSLREGDRVLVWSPSANKDHSQFPNPETLDIDRENSASHVSFGGGRHTCLGAQLARVEVSYIISAFLRRMPNYSVDRSRSRRFKNSGNMYGWWEMPARANCA